MDKNNLRSICYEKKRELLESQFDDLSLSSVHLLQDTHLAVYTASIIRPVEDELMSFLRNLWYQERGADKREFEAIMDRKYMRMCVDVEYRKQLTLAMRDVQRITLWEQLTDSNYKDEDRFRRLLRAYANQLLDNMICDFLEDV